MKMNKLVFLFFSLLLLASCKGGTGGGNKDEKIDFAMLKGIKVGEYSLTAEELEKARTTEGLSKQFEATFPATVVITPETEGNVKAEFKKGTSAVTLSTAEQVIKIEASEKNKKSSIYTLKFSKIVTDGPATDQAVLTAIRVEIGQEVIQIEGDQLKHAKSVDGYSISCPPSATPAKIKVTPHPADAKVEWDPADAKDKGVTLSPKEQLVTITVSKEGLKQNVYRLRLSTDSDEVFLKDLWIEGGTEKYTLSEDDWNAAEEDAGADIALNKAFSEKVTVKYTKNKLGDIVTSEPESLENIKISKTDKTKVKVKVANKKKSLTYTLNLLATDKKKPALLKSLSIKDDNAKATVLDKEDLNECATAEGYSYPDCLVKKSTNVVLTVIGEKDVSVKLKSGATANPQEGNKVVATAVVPKDGTEVVVVFETSGTDMEATTYTLKLAGSE